MATILGTIYNAINNSLNRIGAWVTQPFRVPTSREDRANINANLTTGQVAPLPFGGPAIYPDPNAERFVKYGYSGNASIYTIVSLVARKFASIPRCLYKIDTLSKEAKASHLRVSHML